MSNPRTLCRSTFLVLLLTLFLALEASSAYYFLQDDNRDYSLPLWLGSYRALSHGQIGEFNFYQSLGMPLLASGQTGGLTPFPYVAIALSRLLLGHVFGAVDIVVFLYFLVGGFGFLYLARELGFSRLAGLFGAVAWTFNPFNVYVAVSWVHIAPLVAFLPWIVTLILRLYRRPSLSGVLALTAVHVLLLFTGYVPWLMFIALFEVGLVGALLLSDLRKQQAERARRGLLWLSMVPLASICFGAPLLFPFAHQMTTSAHRSASMDYFDFASQFVRPTVWLNGLLWPSERLYTVERFTPNGFLEIGSPPAITHIGFLTAALSFVGLIAVLRRRQVQPERLLLVAFAGLGLVALLWAFGWFSPVVFHIPFLNRLRWPFRVLAFANFFFTVVAMVGFDEARKHFSPRFVNAALGVTLTLHAANLAAANLWHGQRGFFEHSDPVPLAPPSQVFDQSGRILTVGLMTPFGKRAPTAETLAFDYATLWELFQFGGYETMMPGANSRATLGLNHASPEPSGGSFIQSPDRLPLTYLRAWGVRWYVVTNKAAPAYAPSLEAQGLRLVLSDTQTSVFQDDAARPMVSWNDGTIGGLQLETATNSLRIHAHASRAGTVLVSFLYSPFFDAVIDGEPMPFGANEIGQMTIDLPPGSHIVEMRYRDPYFRMGRATCAAALGIFTIVWIALPRRRFADTN